MEVWHGLPRSLAVIDADVVAVGVVLVVDLLVHAIEEGEQGQILLGAGAGP